MKNILKSTLAFLIAIVGLVGGTIWAVKTEWDWEPLLLVVVSFLQLIGFIIVKSGDDNVSKLATNGLLSNNHGDQNVNVNVNVGPSKSPEDISHIKKELPASGVELTIEQLKPSIKILFIDDDTKFKVVSILKSAGWVQTKIVKDLRNLSDSILQSSHLVFVDIQGVGKLLSFPDQGLGLAASIKEKYPQKKVIIYSADSEGTRFHKAFRLADDQLSKNAVPYEFETIIETMTFELSKNGLL